MGVGISLQLSRGYKSDQCSLVARLSDLYSYFSKKRVISSY
jgi:hypothetical protein